MKNGRGVVEFLIHSLPSLSHQHKLMHGIWVEYFKLQFWTVYCCFKILYLMAHDLKIELMVAGLKKRTTITRASVISKNDFRLSQKITVNVVIIWGWEKLCFALYLSRVINKLRANFDILRTTTVQGILKYPAKIKILVFFSDIVL